MNTINYSERKKKIFGTLCVWEEEIQLYRKDLDNLSNSNIAEECFIEQCHIINDALEKMSACLYEQERYFPIKNSRLAEDYLEI